MLVISINEKFAHLQEAIDAVENRVKDFNEKRVDKIKASSGLILTRETKNGDIEILMGRLNKLDRPEPKDIAGVHGSYGNFSGGVELQDSGQEIPTVLVAAAREVREESLGALDDQKVLDLLSLPTTKLIKNVGWKHFTVASFHVHIPSQVGDEIVEAFNSKKDNVPQHEITQLAWVSLKELVEAQTQKDKEYDTLRAELEEKQGRPFTADELRVNEPLGIVYNINPLLASGIRVAHFVARTLFSIKDNLSI